MLGLDFKLPKHGDELISTKCPSGSNCGLYSFTGKNGPLRKATFDQNKFVKLALTSVYNRCREDTRKKTDKSKKGVLFSDYKVEQPLVSPKGRGRGSQWADMGETDREVTMFRFVWKKNGTPEQRLKELNDLLAEHGIFLD